MTRLPAYLPTLAFLYKNAKYKSHHHRISFLLLQFSIQPDKCPSSWSLLYMWVCVCVVSSIKKIFYYYIGNAFFLVPQYMYDIYSIRMYIQYSLWHTRTGLTNWNVTVYTVCMCVCVCVCWVLFPFLYRRFCKPETETPHRSTYHFNKKKKRLDLDNWLIE